MTRFNIGDTVWHARAQNTKKFIECPDCFGTKYLKVILGDGTELTIDCAGCSGGSWPGAVKSYDYDIEVRSLMITGMQINQNIIEYHSTIPGSSSYWNLSQSDVFATREEAEVRSAVLMDEHKSAEIKRLASKEKDTRTWAWHVHYHRDCIRKANKDIEYHAAKLAFALTHKKEMKHGTS